MSVEAAAILPNRRGLLGSLSDTFWRRPRWLIALLLLPAALWLGIVYLGSLLALLLQSFYHLDDFSGTVIHEFTLQHAPQFTGETVHARQDASDAGNHHVVSDEAGQRHQQGDDGGDQRGCNAGRQRSSPTPLGD